MKEDHFFRLSLIVDGSEEADRPPLFERNYIAD